MSWPKRTGDCYLPEKQLEEMQIFPFYFSACSPFTNIFSGVRGVADSLQGCVVTTGDLASPQVLFAGAVAGQEYQIRFVPLPAARFRCKHSLAVVS